MLAKQNTSKKGQSGIWLYAIVLSVIILSVVVGISRIRRFQSDVVDPEAYGLIVTGMTQDQVLGILGEPTVIKSGRKDHVVWRYQKTGVWEFVEIEFGSEGKVKSKFRDS